MAKRTHRWAPKSVSTTSFMTSFILTAICFCCGLARSPAQVFVVGERSATESIKTDFTPTSLQLPAGHLSERGRRELIRNLEAEQGFAHRALPMGAGLSLEANGPLTPGPDQYKKMIYEKGQSSAPGDRVEVTALTIKADRIIVDLNGGPFAKHRFLSHVSFGDAPVVGNPTDKATGSRVTLVFQHGVPEISAPEVKALLAPVIDFGAKTAIDAYADTLPGPVKEAVAAHEALVGMDRKMVLASLGSPETKVREHDQNETEGTHYEEWIYGHVPQTVKFVRFDGDRVVLVKIAALGKPIEIHNQNEMGEFAPAPPTREIALGDGANPNHAAGAPTLRQPGEALPAATSTNNRVQYPPPTKSGPSTAPIPPPPGSNDPIQHLVTATSAAVPSL